ncbi:hypothetical protein GCM10023322_47960 [Rugosimonospora acidiphila]|uniref:Uncharacterized protein n=1 Tax=Rugosimonospora acidiphila TaxID=556531 RepID=A0ABP9S698_9ACTN
MTVDDMSELRGRLATLAEEAVPTAGYAEVRQRAGRLRRRRVAALASSALVVALGIGVAGHGALPGLGGGNDTALGALPAGDPGRLASCPARKLPLPTGVRSVLVNAADPTGRYVVGDTTEPDASGGRLPAHPILWDRGVPRLIAGASGSAVAVNSHGVVVGENTGTNTSLPIPLSGSAWIFQNGKVSALAPPAGYTSAFVSGLNDGGDVVGYVSGKNSPLTVPVVWKAGGPARVLAVPGSLDSVLLRGIADDGTIVGDVSRVGGNVVYTWDERGNARMLPAPAGYPGGDASTAINGSWVAGYARKEPAGDQTAVRWNLLTGAVTAYPGMAVFAQINAKGVAVAQVVGPDGKGHEADLADGGRVISLPAATKGTAVAMSVNDDNSAVAGYFYVHGTEVGTPVVWSCRD